MNEVTISVFKAYGAMKEMGELALSNINRLDAEIRRLRQTLELIRDNGGTSYDETGATCGGSWCSEQARRTLE